MAARKRREDEEFKKYRENLKKEKKLLRLYLRGKLVWHGKNGTLQGTNDERIKRRPEKAETRIQRDIPLTYCHSHKKRYVGESMRDFGLRRKACNRRRRERENRI